MLSRRLSVWPLLLLLIGCQTTSSNLSTENVTTVSSVERVLWPENQYQELSTKVGHLNLSGSIVMLNAQGKLIPEVIAGSTIYLNPVTSYSKQFFDSVVLRKQGFVSLSEVDKRLEPFVKTTQSDMNGNFTFKGIPKGDYYVYFMVNLREHQDHKYYREYLSFNGLVGQKIHLNNNDSVQLKNKQFSCYLTSKNTSKSNKHEKRYDCYFM